MQMDIYAPSKGQEDYKWVLFLYCFCYNSLVINTRKCNQNLHDQEALTGSSLFPLIKKPLTFHLTANSTLFFPSLNSCASSKKFLFPSHFVFSPQSVEICLLPGHFFEVVHIKVSRRHLVAKSSFQSWSQHLILGHAFLNLAIRTIQISLSLQFSLGSWSPFLPFTLLFLQGCLRGSVG